MYGNLKHRRQLIQQFLLMFYVTPQKSYRTCFSFGSSYAYETTYTPAAASMKPGEPG